MPKINPRALPLEEKAALLAYASRHGRFWKRELQAAWMNGRTSTSPTGRSSAKSATRTGLRFWPGSASRIFSPDPTKDHQHARNPHSLGPSRSPRLRRPPDRLEHRRTRPAAQPRRHRRSRRHLRRRPLSAATCSPPISARVSKSRREWSPAASRVASTRPTRPTVLADMLFCGPMSTKPRFDEHSSIWP
jgi:hypothetical protein